MTAMVTRTVRTTDALRLAGLESIIWKGVMAHHLYAAAPQPDVDGRRAFDLDDIIALRIFRELLEHGLTRTYAAMIASDARFCLRAHPADLDSVSVIRGQDARGQPRPVVVVTPPAGVEPLMRFSVAKMRAALEAAFTGYAS